MPPTHSIFVKFEEEFLLMASMGDVPNATGDIVAMGSWHRRRGLKKDIRFVYLPKLSDNNRMI